LLRSCNACRRFRRTSFAQAQDLAAARPVKKCLACHAIGPGAKTRSAGYELLAAQGRQVEAIRIRPHKDSGLTGTMQRQGVHPRSQGKIPKTKMASPHQERKEIDNLCAYLAQFKADGSKNRPRLSNASPALAGGARHGG